jgi:CheY-like chemotaxis protein
VGQLAGGIAHDFNNLLTTVVLYAAIALRRRDLPAGLEGSLETILEESQRASQLVDQILDFSRRSPMEKEPVDLLLNLEQATDVLRRTIPKSIRVTLEAEPGPYVVEADPTRVQQVVMNLALNARDAMPNGGRLDIRLGRTAVRADGRPPVRGMPVGDWVRLSFTDTGMGMSEQVRAHLFEPFFTTKAPGEGTGLGLAQVHGIVMQHGGYIDVESEPGAGSTFTVYLPSHQEKAVRDAEADAAAYPEGSGERILLVEDEPPVRAAIEDSLEALNYQVLCAEHGEDALEIYRSTQDIDLVVTDLVMPVMGGAELAEALREENRDLKIIALTGHDAKQELDELERTTARAVIQKPFGIDELAIVVQRVLDEG